MKQSELSIALSWAQIEGWNPGIHDADLFYQADPNGFFVGEINNQIVAVGSAVNYDDRFAFCGLYIVAPEHRGKGYGLALTKHRLKYCGERNIGIDGVLENVEIYKNIGYVPYYQNYRYQFEASHKTNIDRNITEVSEDSFFQVLNYDKKCFPANRDEFLISWITQDDAKSLVYAVDDEVKGFIVRRKCHQGHKIGPLFADNDQIAALLLDAIQTGIQGEVVILDVPGNNPDAIHLAESLNMEVVFSTARMYQKGLPDIDNSKVFGITTFELG
jgi:GNAT superfamily N-acetyltransferase